MSKRLVRIRSKAGANLTMVSDVGVLIFRRPVDEAEDLALEVEASDGSVVAGRDQLAAVEGVEGQAVHRRCVRLKVDKI